VYYCVDCAAGEANVTRRPALYMYDVALHATVTQTPWSKIKVK